MVKKELLFLLMLILINFFLCSPAFSLEKTSTGFYYPMGTSSYESEDGNWLELPKGQGGNYFSGYYHIGVDMMFPADTKVYPVYDGIVRVRSENGWTLGHGKRMTFRVLPIPCIKICYSIRPSVF